MTKTVETKPSGNFSFSIWIILPKLKQKLWFKFSSWYYTAAIENPLLWIARGGCYIKKVPARFVKEMAEISAMMPKRIDPSRYLLGVCLWWSTTWTATSWVACWSTSGCRRHLPGMDESDGWGKGSLLKGSFFFPVLAIKSFRKYYTTNKILWGEFKGCFKTCFFSSCVCLPSWKLAYPLPAVTFESMIFLFVWCDMWSFPGGYLT